MTETYERPRVPFGTVIGVSPGEVPAYSSDYDTADDKEYPDRHSYRSYLNGTYMGYKWQCVEFARRWLYVNFGYTFADVAMAYEIFNLAEFTEIATGRRLPMQSFENGSKRLPEPGCLLIWGEGGEFERTGHVAIVTEVFPDRVRIAEQNYSHRPWADGCNYSREIEARTSPEGEYWIRSPSLGGGIIGWVLQTDDAQYAVSRPEFNRSLLAMDLRKLESLPDNDNSWLNDANPVEAAYAEMMHGDFLSARPEDQDRYIRISQAAEDRLKRASNELHALFLHATNYVLQDEKRLARFKIPPSIWPRIHESWNNRRNQMITGRLDFAMTTEGIKVYEYNADSASCHTETAIIQGKWAEHVGCEDGDDPGANLYERLVDAWRESDAQGLVHILRDDDPEETYHALFMQETIEAAGLKCKVLQNLEGLQWADGGNMLDADGELIRWVWKTWAWETALDQIREECEDDNARLANYEIGQRKDWAPRLVDVLLRKNVTVFEPLWTLIPSNKAILPVLWELFPNHPYLLRATYELDDELKASGYVVKPIVGRCGSNISLIDRDSTLLEHSEGAFDNRDLMYQELFPLPQAGGLNIQICTFTAGSNYAGACARTDYSPIIRSESDLLALRVVPDRDI
ncbi:MAG: bifunctional glutathionylspermidine amidase/synthase [Woeseia sp.]